MLQFAVRATDKCCNKGRLAIACALLLVTAVLSVPAYAQVAVNVTLATSDIFRGESTSDDDGAASLEVAYDHPSGLFAGISLTVAGGEHDPHINGATQYAGYALRRGEISVELGVLHRDYDAKSLVDDAYSPHYFEGFVGVIRRNLKLRLYVSPDYLRDGRTSYYGEANARLFKAGNWSINGHGGISAIPPDIGATGMQFYYDAGVQANRSVGKFALGLGIVTTSYPVFGPDNGSAFFENKPRVFASLSRAF
jgi:uncharacterized protein (TIGR02001 family)